MSTSQYFLFLSLFYLFTPVCAQPSCQNTFWQDTFLHVATYHFLRSNFLFYLVMMLCVSSGQKKTLSFGLQKSSVPQKTWLEIVPLSCWSVSLRDYICEKSSTKPYVAPEEAARKLINCLHYPQCIIASEWHHWGQFITLNAAFSDLYSSRGRNMSARCIKFGSFHGFFVNNRKTYVSSIL